MFRRSKTESTVPAEVTLKEGGKGRPTPTRKEAEAARRAAAKVPRSRKEMTAAQRAQAGDSKARARQGMRNGEEKYLLPRDKGPTKRFIRDFVDARFSFIELIIPLLVITMILGYSGNASLASFGNALLFGSILLVVVDMLMLRRRLRKQIAARFPDASFKGTTYYAVTRAMQMKFMRLPKPQVKIGQELPEHYR